MKARQLALSSVLALAVMLSPARMNSSTAATWYRWDKECVVQFTHPYASTNLSQHTNGQPAVSYLDYQNNGVGRSVRNESTNQWESVSACMYDEATTVVDMARGSSSPYLDRLHFAIPYLGERGIIECRYDGGIVSGIIYDASYRTIWQSGRNVYYLESLYPDWQPSFITGHYWNSDGTYSPTGGVVSSPGEIDAFHLSTEAISFFDSHSYEVVYAFPPGGGEIGPSPGAFSRSVVCTVPLEKWVRWTRNWMGDDGRCLVFGGSFMGVTYAHLSGGSWETEVIAGDLSSWDGDFAVDAAGVPHLATVIEVQWPVHQRALYYYHRAPDGRWLKEVIDSGDELYSVGIQILADGQPCVAYTKTNYGQGAQVMYAQRRADEMTLHLRTNQWQDLLGSPCRMYPCLGDSLFVYGGASHGTQGQFETNGGLPDRQYWTSHDLSMEGVGDFAKVWPKLREYHVQQPSPAPPLRNATPRWAFVDDGLIVPGTGAPSAAVGHTGRPAT